jgi:hypothetical protein
MYSDESSRYLQVQRQPFILVCFFAIRMHFLHEPPRSSQPPQLKWACPHSLHLGLVSNQSGPRTWGFMGKWGLSCICLGCLPAGNPENNHVRSRVLWETIRNPSENCNHPRIFIFRKHQLLLAVPRIIRLDGQVLSRSYLRTTPGKSPDPPSLHPSVPEEEGFGPLNSTCNGACREHVFPVSACASCRPCKSQITSPLSTPGLRSGCGQLYMKVHVPHMSAQLAPKTVPTPRLNRPGRVSERLCNGRLVEIS